METLTLAEAMKRHSQSVSKSKYNNVFTEYDGRMYHSSREADYARELDACRKAVNKQDKVVKVEAQVTYPIAVNGVKVCKYILDFKVTYADGRVEHVDVKSEVTRKIPEYRLKKKLMLAVYGIEIIEVL